MNGNKTRMAPFAGVGATVALVAAGLLPGQAQATATGASVAANPANPAERIAGTPGPLRLHAGTWQPGTQAAPAGKATRTVRSLAASDKGLHIVQFNGAIRAQWLADVRALGVGVLSYLPDNAYLVRMSGTQAGAVKGLSSVSWVGRYQGDWKMTSQAKAQAAKVERFNPGLKVSASNPNRGQYAVIPAADSIDALPAVARSAGAIVLEQASDGIVVIATAAQTDALAASEVVQGIDLYVPRELHNDDAQGLILGGHIANTRGYDGRTQIGGVIDTGFATGSVAQGTAAVPPERIVAIADSPTPPVPDCLTPVNDGPQDANSGHGTHTATTVLGQGDQTGLAKAAANRARMVFIAVEDYVKLQGACGSSTSNMYALGGLSDPAAVIGRTAEMGARVTSNSWGADARGEYTSMSSSVDRKVDSLRDVTVVFSAGNAGQDSNRDGAVDEGSLGSPASAKNVIAVGASETRRVQWRCDPALTYPSTSLDGVWLGKKSCQALGGSMGTLPTWGAWWPSRFPTEPLKSDNQSNDPEQMAAFSSRGPTTDGRIKPEVVAPGSWILSGYSPLHQEGYGTTPNPLTGEYQQDGMGFPANKDYKYDSGTSMAAPAVAGGALVVRDFMQRNYNLDASAALVKTALVNSAVDLADENNDSAADNDKPIPNADEGWGRINLDNATRGTARYIDEGAPLALGQASETVIRTDGSKPLKVSMAWTDPAAAPNATTTLVNDLNLSLISPSGVVYLGNDFAGGWSAANGARADTVNNLENVYIQTPEPGRWKVRVFGANVPTGGQPFALTIDGSTSRMATTTAPVVTNPGLITYALGEPLSRKVEAYDPRRRALTYSASGLPDGFTIDGATGVLSGQAGAAAADSEVTITVTNRRGQKSSVTFWMRAAAEPGGTAASSETP